MQDAIVPGLVESRQRFLELAREVRPELHRYCARMTGSVADGEDVVQDTLARAYYDLAELKELPALRSWLFRIAHNRALDLLRRHERRMGQPLEQAMNLPADADDEPSSAVTRQHALRLAVSRFLEIAPLQRSCVVLKDVLDYSLADISTLLDLSVPAVKAALHRGRARLREISISSEPIPPPSVSPALVRYAALFNARDWDGVRAMLVDEVKLDLVSREKRSGRRHVGHYFTNYGKVHDWHLVPGRLDGREVLAVFRSPGDARPGYFIELVLVNGRVAVIRDFRYVPYIGRDAEIELVRGAGE